MTRPSRLGVRAIVRAVRDRELSVEEVVTDCLEHIVDLESSLGAWAFLDPDLALEQARQRDASPPSGELHGVPVGIKDIIDTADQPTAYGSPIHLGHRPDRDATVVTRLRQAGAVVLGKTVTTEFALFAPGPTTNPHDPTRTPGGSSSGSAAAVAAGTIPLTLGTQTAGSVVRPASFCGVVGAKPTFSRVPVDGVRPCAVSLDTVGVFTRDVDDAALALGVIAGDPDGFARARPVTGLRVGFCRTPQWDSLEAPTRTAIEQVAGTLSTHSAVAEVVEVELPEVFSGAVEAQEAIMASEVLDALADERRRHPDRLSPSLRAYLDTATRLGDGAGDARRTAEACRAALPALFAHVDALVAPAVVGEAPPVATTGDPLLCRTWTLVGVPAVSVPGLTGPAGLPLGVQVVGPPGGDAVALVAAGVVHEHLARDAR